MEDSIMVIRHADENIITCSYDGHIIVLDKDLNILHDFNAFIGKYRYTRQITMSGDTIAFISENGEDKNCLVIAKIKEAELEIEHEMYGYYELLEMQGDVLYVVRKEVGENKVKKHFGCQFTNGNLVQESLISHSTSDASDLVLNKQTGIVIMCMSDKTYVL